MSKIEDEVCEKIQQRAEVGLKKYGTTMEREDFSDLDWMNYLQEELMDGAVYLQRMINNYQDALAELEELTKRVEHLEEQLEEYLE
ncbi:MAG: hypothetical protein CME55_00085 [Halieaceae bacterium]|nr:hypothetical protein [Halieaceae bacterium]|tara:strand:+ start:906 stop:1163 length:258 start_codon:yes stop_codon:yes gene_type:complete